ncbi:MAG: hypothetical protein JSV19_08575 [Phycisphaerales bacterium]|nr:MAG: hypothetical protein JSV19_08575 [Phycisphaerales bacterium]
MGKKQVVYWIAVVAVALSAAPLAADIADDQVLVVYNSASPEAVTLKNTYLSAHPGIPAANLLDLNDASLLLANITQAAFVTKVRDPIRAYLAAAGDPQPSDIIVILLLRPFPHRMYDTDAPLVGDSPSNAANEVYPGGDATYASVDAELVLLWQNLNTGEAGGMMDSKSDNMIDNPYHQSTASIDAFSRAWITTAKTFTNRSNVVWVLGGAGSTRLQPGDMYLVCRIDGTTLADAQAEIQRAQGIRANRGAVRVVLDEYDLNIAGDLDDDPLFTTGDPFLAGDDYEETDALLTAAGWDVRYDDTFNFISGDEETTPLIAYASYGENHDLNGAGENPPGTAVYINSFTFAQGAIFNTVESYNARAFNGLGTLFGLEQSADFITAGGTFAVGHVFEPFTFTLADNEFLFSNMLIHGRQWAEAAYASIPALSWQHVVVGDPLARIHLLGDLDFDRDVDLGDYALWETCLAGPDVPSAGGCQEGDFDGDDDVDLGDFAQFQTAFTGG